MTEGSLRRISSKKKVKFVASLKKRSSSTGAIRSSNERESETRETARFRLQFTQGDLHCRLSHNTPPGHLPRKLEWDTDLTLMNDEQRCALLIKFSDAMGIMSHPYRIVAEQGMIDLLSTATSVNSVMAALPAIVNGIRFTLLHPDQSKRVYALKIMCMLTSIHGCGPNLVPFYGRLLAPLRKYLHTDAENV
ncbi:unnamed protein product [Cylicocyclus nassatus]|uniref:Uncharacterized protein n=1 Tax=Cylicocyclus nassatus TaxID=53992 RepID=A0AA36HAI7_CYLNA|nr:unnamed protein product [Cylicocyclus nassatus]